MRIRLNRTNIKKLEPRRSSYYAADEEFPAFRVRVTPKGAKTFYLLYRNAQHRQITFKIGVFGEITPEAARDIAEKKMAEIKLGGDPAAEKEEGKRQAERSKYSTLGGFLEHKFEPWAVENRKTGANMVARLRSAFAEHLDKPLDEITPWIIEKWRKERFKAGRKPGTVNRLIAALKSVLSRAVEWDVIEHHPLRKLKLSKEDTGGVVRYLTVEEDCNLREALACRDQRIKDGRKSGNQWRKDRSRELMPEIEGNFADHLSPMVLLSLSTGMRRGEVFNLRWEDIDFDNESLVIHGHSAKSGKTRHIPLNRHALFALEEWQRHTESRTGLVFPGKDGKPFDNVKKAWEGLLADAGIQNFRWHDMRHHFASKLVMANVDLNTVRELLGHSDFKLTLRYAHLAPEHKAAAVAKLVEEG